MEIIAAAANLRLLPHAGQPQAKGCATEAAPPKHPITAFTRTSLVPVKTKYQKHIGLDSRLRGNDIKGDTSLCWDDKGDGFHLATFVFLAVKLQKMRGQIGQNGQMGQNGHAVIGISGKHRRCTGRIACTYQKGRGEAGTKRTNGTKGTKRTNQTVVR